MLQDLISGSTLQKGIVVTLGGMAALGIAMFLWFKIKGWVNIYK